MSLRPAAATTERHIQPQGHSCSLPTARSHFCSLSPQSQPSPEQACTIPHDPYAPGSVQPAAHSACEALDFWPPTYNSRLPFRPPRTSPPDTTTPNISSPLQDAPPPPGPGGPFCSQPQQSPGDHPKAPACLCEALWFLSAPPPSHPPPQAQNILLTLLPWQGGTGSHTAAGRRGWRRLLLLLLPWGKRTRGRGWGLPTGRRRRWRHHAHRWRRHHTCG